MWYTSIEFLLYQQQDSDRILSGIKKSAKSVIDATLSHKKNSKIYDSADLQENLALIA